MTTMDKPSYEQLLAQAGELEPADQLRLLEGLAILLRQRVVRPADYRITALRGLGKEVWQGIGAQEYQQQERASWDG